MSYLIVEGNVTSDASLRNFTSRRTGAEIPISNATIAVNDRRRDPESNQWVDTGKTFFEVTVSGAEAIHFAATAKKGARMIIAGTTYVEESTDSEGNRRVRRRLAADHHGLSSKYAAARSASTSGRSTVESSDEQPSEPADVS